MKGSGKKVLLHQYLVTIDFGPAGKREQIEHAESPGGAAFLALAALVWHKAPEVADVVGVTVALSERPEVVEQARREIKNRLYGDDPLWQQGFPETTPPSVKGER